jgi:CheY-like chemotaxis protein
MLGIGAKLDLPTVLLIDDDLVSREVMATILTMSGYTVHTANSGVDSLKMIETGQCVPQVILMDVQMPDLSGLELIGQLRTHSRASIYTVSASRAPDEVVAASDGFLLKPVYPEALHKLLEKHTPPPAAPPPESSEPVVSARILSQFRQMMPDVTVREIYAAVTADLEKRAAALETAIARSDSAEIRRIGHAIKGGCGMAGALQAARIGAQLESGSDQLDDCAAALRELHVATRNLESMLKAEFPA